MSLNELIAEGADLLLELRRLEGNGKLSAKAFVKEALGYAGCDAKRIAQAEKLLDESHAADAARAFIRAMMKALRTPNYTRCPANAAKALRVWGSEEAGMQLASLRVTLPEAVAIAVRKAVKKWPDTFGEIENWTEHQQRTTEVQQRLNGIYEAMRTAVSGDDFTIDLDVTISERDAGLARVVLRRNNRISLTNPRWPELLVESELASEPQASEDQLREQAGEEIEARSAAKRHLLAQSEQTKRAARRVLRRKLKASAAAEAEAG